jgi:hypothetical protein
VFEAADQLQNRHSTKNKKVSQNGFDGMSKQRMDRSKEAKKLIGSLDKLPLINLWNRTFIKRLKKEKMPQ